MARGGPFWTSVRQVYKGLEGCNGLGCVQLHVRSPGRWTVCALHEQGLSPWLSEHQSLLHDPLKAASKVVRVLVCLSSLPLEARGQLECNSDR